MTLPPNLDKQTLRRIETEIAAGRKISAIKILGEATGLGLAEIKAAVEDMVPGALSPAGNSSARASSLQEVEEHLRSGKKIDAIKAYRELTGCGLKEAKEAVEAISRGNVPISTGSIPDSHHATSQHAAPTVSTTSGCLTTSAIVLAAALALYWL